MALYSCPVTCGPPSYGGGGTQTESVGPACILRDCAPLELTGAVIVLVAVLMVYDRIAVRIRYEHFGYQYMDLHIFAV